MDVVKILAGIFLRLRQCHINRTSHRREHYAINLDVIFSIRDGLITDLLIGNILCLIHIHSKLPGSGTDGNRILQYPGIFRSGISRYFIIGTFCLVFCPILLIVTEILEGKFILIAVKPGFCRIICHINKLV